MRVKNLYLYTRIQIVKMVQPGYKKVFLFFVITKINITKLIIPNLPSIAFHVFRIKPYYYQTQNIPFYKYILNQMRPPWYLSLSVGNILCRGELNYLCFWLKCLQNIWHLLFPPNSPLQFMRKQEIFKVRSRGGFVVVLLSYRKWKMEKNEK